MKRILLAGLVLGSTIVSAQTEDVVLDDRWYTGVMGGIARPGDDRLTGSKTAYFGAYFGRFFSQNFSLDLQIDSYSTDFERDELARIGFDVPIGFDRDFDIFGYGLTGRYHFGDMGDRHRPYGLVGLGIQEHNNAFDEGRDMYISWGLGIQSKLGENVRLRTQLEGRYDNDRETRNTSHGFGDMIASIGLGFSFGEPPRPPQPAPAAPPSEPVRPAPPPPAPRPQPEPEVMFEFDSTVLFDFDSSALRPEARAELDRASDILAPRDDIILIEVAGHTDSIGTNEYNQDLSIRRGQSVADYLVQNGVSRDRLRVVGYGETRPKVPNDSPENRQQNRRVVLSILNRRN
ncbi:MAG TPA: OmpA family protein [Wenzhouxiangellaceae bacterium]|nr:OmpA family protein [Wenzhouxiangellaceae bacterium]